MIKSFTSLEQSVKLAEILPLESADMSYMSYDNHITLCPYIEMIDIGFNKDEVIPCWSLASLLGVLPETITKYIDDERCKKTFHLNLFRSYYHCCSYSFAPSISDDDGNNTLYCIGRDNWVDACVAMIYKLNELKIL